MQKEKPYKSSMAKVTGWIFVLVVIVFIGIYFQAINIWINRGETFARVISITEISPSASPYPQSTFAKTYHVVYTFTVDGKPYKGSGTMKLQPTFDPNTIIRLKYGVSPADIADIPIIYCKHWPSFFEVKNKEVEWK